MVKLSDAIHFREYTDILNDRKKTKITYWTNNLKITLEEIKRLKFIEGIKTAFLDSMILIISDEEKCLTYGLSYSENSETYQGEFIMGESTEFR